MSCALQRALTVMFTFEIPFKNAICTAKSSVQKMNFLDDFHNLNLFNNYDANRIAELKKKKNEFN